MVDMAARKPLATLQAKALPVGLHADAGMRGLYLRVLYTGGRSRMLRYQLNGRRRHMHLGALEALGVAEARIEATKHRRLLLEKTGPIQQRHVQRAAKQHAVVQAAWTFRKAAEAVHQTLRPGWKNSKHAAEWINTLTVYAYPHIGEMPASAVDVAAVVRVLRPIWTDKPETARRVRQRLDAVMRWAVAHDYASANPVGTAGHSVTDMEQPAWQ